RSSGQRPACLFLASSSPPRACRTRPSAALSSPRCKISSFASCNPEGLAAPRAVVEGRAMDAGRAAEHDTREKPAAEHLRSAIQDASQGLVERETLVELVVLSAVAREHMLVVGPPGTAKSEAVRRIARRLRGRYFEYLLGRFTE